MRATGSVPQIYIQQLQVLKFSFLEILFLQGRALHCEHLQRVTKGFWRVNTEL